MKEYKKSEEMLKIKIKKFEKVPEIPKNIPYLTKNDVA